MKWYFDASVYVYLFLVWYFYVRDNEALHYVPHPPENFETPEPLRYQFPFYNFGGWLNYEGYKLATYVWTPSSPEKKALVFIFPGYGSSAELYAAESKMMAEQGYRIYAMDPVGQGRSEGLQMHVADFNKSCEDYAKWVEYQRKKHPDHKIFMWGGSMGGTTVLTMILQNLTTADGLILTCPAVKISDDMYPWLRQLGYYVSEFIPTWPLAPPVHTERTCLDENVDIALQRHPLVYHGRIRAGTGMQLLKASEWVHLHLDKVHVPFLVMHGSDDHLVKAEESSQLLYEKAKSKDKTLKIWPGELHNFLMSPNHKTYIQEAINWMDKRVKESATAE